MNSYQMVLHRPVETARVIGKFVVKLPLTRLGELGQVGSSSDRLFSGFSQSAEELFHIEGQAVSVSVSDPFHRNRRHRSEDSIRNLFILDPRSQLLLRDLVEHLKLATFHYRTQQLTVCLIRQTTGSLGVNRCARDVCRRFWFSFFRVLFSRLQPNPNLKTSRLQIHPTRFR